MRNIQHIFPIVLVIVFLIFSSSMASAKEITVDDHPGADFSSIQAAINAAQPGDKIIVKAESGLVADFYANPTSGSAPLFVQFADRSQNATGWNWNFDDGNTSTAQNTMNTFSKAGEYTVNLTVTNENDTDSKNLEITVNEAPIEEKVPPVADFDAYPTSGDAPLSVQFTDLSQNAAARHWDFGDGGSSNETNPNHNYSEVGNYIVDLTINNENGTDSKTLEITVRDTPIEEKVLPVADFNSGSVGGLTIQFVDLSEDANAWHWDFGDGATSVEFSPVHTYPSAGNYNVNLTVSNENGTDSKNLEIIAGEAPIEEKILPVANFNAMPASGYAPFSVRFTDLSTKYNLKKLELRGRKYLYR